MAGDLPIWIERYTSLFGCNCSPAAVAVAIEDLLRESERRRQTIGRLRGHHDAQRRLELAKSCRR